MLQKIKQWTLSWSKNEIMILLFVVSLFISVYAVAAMMLAYLFFIPFSGQWKKALPAKAADWILLGFAISAAVSTVFFSKDGYLINGFIPKRIFLFLALGIFLLCFEIFFFEKTMTRRVFRFGLKLMAFLSISSFVIALFQKIFHIYPDPIERPGRVASVYNNENYYGMVIEFIVLVCLFLFFKTKNKKEKLAYALILFANLIGLWFCQTRMAFIVIAVTVFIFLFINARKLSYVILGFLGIVVVLVILNPSILPRFDSISSYLSYRLGIWDVALKAFMEQPILGRGYYAYSTVWKEVGSVYHALHAHNLYIEVLLNFGVVGTGLIGTYSAMKILQCLKACFQSKNALDFSLVLGFALTVILHSVADTTMFWPQSGFFAVYLLIQPKMFLTELKGENS